MKNRLTPHELALLAERLSKAPTESEIAELRERLTCGFYGIEGQDFRPVARPGTS